LDSRDNKSFLKRSDLRKKREGEREKVRLGGWGKMIVLYYRLDKQRRHHDIGEVARIDARRLRKAK
jgi:hypothetical protein